jgi:HK97 family phage prohead protease
MTKIKLTDGMEVRALAPSSVQLRAAVENDRPVLTGYAARFNSLSVPLDDGEGEYRERILPGAFSRSLAEGPDVVALAHHDERLVLGRRSAETLKLVEDDHGLRVLLYPPDTTLGRDIVESVSRGDLASMSFGFLVDDEDYRNEDGMVIREVKQATVFEVSIVTWPAYESTSIKVRSDVPSRVKALREAPTSQLQMLFVWLQMHAEKIGV